MRPILALFALAVLAGCPSEPPAEVEPPVTDGPGGAVHRPNPNELEAKRRAEVEAERADKARADAERAQAEEARKEKEAKQEAERKAAQEASEGVREGDLKIFAGHVLLSFGRWVNTVAEPNFVEVSLTVGKATDTFPAPLDFGLGAVREGVRSVLRTALPDLWRNHEQNGWQGQLRAVANQALRKRLGGDLFAPEPGRVNAAPLKKLLDALYVEPNGPLWGTVASRAYALVRQPVRDYTKAYGVMKPKKKAATKAYRDARAKFAPGTADTYSNDMMEWYYAQADAYDIAGQVGLGERRGAYLMSGFWMRRFDDGTDTVCYAFLRKVTKAYDPTWKP